MASLFGFFLQVGRNLFVADFLAVGAVEVDGLHRDQVDHAFELSSLPIGNCIRTASQSQLFADLLDHAERIGAGAVHLVDERQARHVVALHLAVDGHRLRLHATDGAEHQNGAVEHAQAALHFDGEIDVPRRIDQVDLMVDSCSLQ